MFERCKKNVINQFESIKCLQKNIKSKSSVLILDTITAPYLSSLISMPQLLSIGIKNLQRVDKIKKPQPSSIAIYYISCSSLKFVYQDFDIKLQDKNIKKQSQQQHDTIPLYFSINLLICEQVSKDTLKQISQHQQVMDRIASFGQLYIPCKYTYNNVGLIPFSKSASENIQALRKLTKTDSANERLSTRLSTKPQQQKLQSQKRKRTQTGTQILNDNLSCLSDINFYQYSQKQKNQTRFLKRRQQIQQNIKIYAHKLSSSIIAGFNIGQYTQVKLITYQSKFCHKLKQSFKSSLLDVITPKKSQKQKSTDDDNQNNTLFQQSKDQPQAKQVIIILVDRSIDNLSPLVRSYLYQPLLMDIFNINDPPSTTIKIISKKLSPTTIQTNDKIYQKYKSTNIFVVFANINDDFKYFISTSKAAKFQKQQKQLTTKSQKSSTTPQIQLLQIPSTKSTQQIRQVIKQIPQYKKNTNSFHINISILTAIKSLKTQLKLDQQIDLQHLIITGYNRQFKIQKDKKILDKLNLALADPNLNITDRSRLYVLAACFLDISNDQRNKLIKKLSQIQKHGDIAMGLSKIMNKQIKKYPVSSYATKNPKQSDADKHQCTISNFLEQLNTNPNPSSKLSKQFTTQQIKSASLKKKPLTKDAKNRQKSTEYVICMCGGMGYNQIADIQRMMRTNDKSNTNISFLTDYIFTPSKYLQQLCNMIS